MCWTSGSQSCANPTEDAKLNQLVAEAWLLVEASPHQLLVQGNAPEPSPKLTGSSEPAPGAAQLAPSRVPQRQPGSGICGMDVPTQLHPVGSAGCVGSAHEQWLRMHRGTSLHVSGGPGGNQDWVSPVALWEWL